MTQLGQNDQNPMKIYTVGYSCVPNRRNTEMNEHVEEIAKKSNSRTPVLLYIYCNK